MMFFDLAQDYNRENFNDFLSDFLPDDFESDSNEVFYTFKNIKNGFKLGTCKSLDLDIFEFCTNSNRDPRVTLTREVVSCMKKYSYAPNALVIFYTDDSHSWRLSLITTDYTFDNGMIKTDHSNPRRFSFKLGAGCKKHTPEQMLFKKGKIQEHTENGKTISALEDLKSRFALEVVSKQFFDEYKVFYEDFVQYITGNRYVKVGGKYERKPVSKENTKIFSQFKKLANDDYELACKYVRDYIKKFMGRLVFLEFLQKKGWLGVANNDSWGKGNKNFLLDLFNTSNYKNDFLEKVLEPLFFGMINTDFEDRKNVFKSKKWDLILLDVFKQIPYLNGGLFEDDTLDNIEITFPQEMFSNPEKADKERTFNDKKDYSKESYPFTESCGLLDFFARYNFTIDETDPADMEIGVEPEMLGKIFENLLEDNKDKGAFYTPKEIVQYMCRESLIAYLGDNEKNRTLITNHNAEYSDSEKKELINKLKAVKVCDPAVGSGAFPMGMLNELFACRIALGENEEAAEIKKQIVRENIYGVDIEKGAVDIARLRFWLAIIVDEKEPIPLPNLDYKIMQGNSLIESYEGIDLSHMLETPSNGEFDYTAEQRKLLKTNMDEFFDDNNHKVKSIKNDLIKSLVFDLTCATCGFKSNSNQALDLYEKIWNGTTDFFLWHTWFSDVFNRPNDCNGFDIVIGNPPYNEMRDLTKQFQTLYKECIYYEYAKGGRINLFQFFYPLAISISKQGGIINLIVQNSLLGEDSALNNRKFIFDNTKILHIDSFPERDNVNLRVFESAKMSVCICFLQKEKNNDNSSFIVSTWKDKYMSSKKDLYITKNRIKSIFPDDYTIPICNEADLSLLIKMKQNASDFKLEASAGEVDMTKYKPFFTNNSQLSRIITGAQVQKWFITDSPQQGEINYIDIKQLSLSEKRKECFETERLVMQRITGVDSKIRIIATILPPNFLCANSTNFIIDSKISLYFILGILNSKAINYFFKQTSTNTNVTSKELSKFPIPKASIEEQRNIISIVNKILTTKKQNTEADTTELESQIDNLVYKLYDLTPEEIKIIEGK